MSYESLRNHIQEHVTDNFKKLYLPSFALKPHVVPLSVKSANLAIRTVQVVAEENPGVRGNVSLAEALRIRQHASRDDSAQLLLDQKKFIERAMENDISIRNISTDHVTQAENIYQITPPSPTTVSLPITDPVRVVVLDNSPSMRDDVFDDVKLGVAQSFRKDECFTVLMMTGSPDMQLTALGLGNLTNSKVKASVLRSLHDIETRIGTVVQKDRLTQVVIVTDGEMFTYLDPPEELIRRIAELNTRGIEVKLIELHDGPGKRQGEWYYPSDVLPKKNVQVTDINTLFNFKDDRVRSDVSSAYNYDKLAHKRTHIVQRINQIREVVNKSILVSLPLISIGFMVLGLYLINQYNSILKSAKWIPMPETIQCFGDHLWGLIKFSSSGANCGYYDFTNAKFNDMIPTLDAFNQYGKQIRDSGETSEVAAGLTLLFWTAILAAKEIFYVQDPLKSLLNRIEKASPMKFNIPNKPKETKDN